MPPTPPLTPTARPDRVAQAHGLLLVAALVMVSLWNTSGPIPGTGWMPLYVPVCLVLLVTTVVVWVRRCRTETGEGSLFSAMLRSLAPPAWWCLAAATALFAYAVGSALLSDPIVWVNKAQVPTVVPRMLVVHPALEALLTTWTAFAIIAAVAPERRFRLLWRMSVLLVPLSLLGWLRIWLEIGGTRLWTQMGGAAVYPVVLMVAFAVAVVGVLRGHRPRVSQGLAVCHLVLLLLTGSRGAIVMIVFFGVVAFVRLARGHSGLGERLAGRSKWVYLLGGVSVLVAAFLSPIMERLSHWSLGRVIDRLNSGSVGRLMTWRIGWGAVTENWQTMLLGVGSGTIWPWYAYESGWQPLPWRSRMSGPFGQTLYHSHSLYLEVMAELGLVGLVLLALVVLPIAVQWIRGGTIANLVLTSVACAGLVGFAFDSYLFKNFSVSLVWWLVVFAVLGGGHRDSVASPAPPHVDVETRR